MQEYILKYIEIAGITGLSIFLVYAIWLKGILHREIVEPDVKALKSEIKTLKERVNTLEEDYKKSLIDINKNFDEVKSELISLTKEVASLSGKFEIYFQNKNN